MLKKVAQNLPSACNFQKTAQRKEKCSPNLVTLVAVESIG
jgi:hypothetical protein